MYNDENFVTLCLSLQLNFILKAYVRCEFIIHSGVSGDTTMCLFLLSHEKLPHSSMKSSYINTHTIIQYVNACACTQRHTEENSTSGDKKFFRANTFFFSSEMERKRKLPVFPAELIGRFPHHLQHQRLLMSSMQGPTTKSLHVHGFSVGKSRASKASWHELMIRWTIQTK